MPEARTEVTITNSHRYAIHVVGRRFSPNKPRTLTLTERQLQVVRGNDWLWIEGEDYGDGKSDQELTKAQIKEQLKELGLPVSGNKTELQERLTAALAEQKEEDPSAGDGDEEE